MYLKTEALVLREVKYKESDMLLTLLTRENGKLFVSARGIRRPKSKLGAACQLFAYSDFTIFENKGKYSVTEAATLDIFAPMRRDMDKFALAAYLSELLECLADEGMACPQLLNLGLNAFYALSCLDRPPEIIKAASELRLMALSGYEPALGECAFCGGEVEGGLFNIKSGLLYCDKCRADTGEGISVPVGGSVLAAMRHIIYDGGKKIFSFALPEKETGELATAAEVFVHAQLERGFRTLDFLKGLNPGRGL